MRKTLLLFLTLLLMAPMLSGCYYYPYHNGHGRGYSDDRDYDRHRDRDRDGYRDYRERR